jgi:hypothetical protein
MMRGGAYINDVGEDEREREKEKKREIIIMSV